MTDWKELGQNLISMLRLRTDPIAYKKFESAQDLDHLEKAFRYPIPSIGGLADPLPMFQSVYG